MAELSKDRNSQIKTGAPPREVRLGDVIILVAVLPFMSLFLLMVELISWASSVRSRLRGFGNRKPPGRRQAVTERDSKIVGEVDEEQVLPQFQRPRGWHLAQRLRSKVALWMTADRFQAVFKLRNRHFLALDLLILSLTPCIALILREEGIEWIPQALPALGLYTALAIFTKISLFYLLGLYGRYWPYASVSDVSRLMVAVGQAAFLLTWFGFASHPFLHPYGLAVSRSVPLIDGMITAILVGGLRFSMRGFYNWHQKNRARRGGQGVLIVGAGETGMMAVREIWANSHLQLEPVAFVDDDPIKVGKYVYGLPVVGTSDDIPSVVDLLDIKRILIALPSVSLPRQNEITNLCRKTGVAVDILPGVYQILAGHKTISPLPKIDIHRLLKREPVKVDLAQITPVLRGARILVTGAGGSIGSELCRQIARYHPAELILLGHGENSIYEINLDLKLRYPDLVTHQVIADVRHAEGIHWAVKKYRPQIIFHMAAHKHIHYMEANATEAVLNNILGTRNVLEAAMRNGVERFVLMSTDKAINPVSVMGATKRIAELLTIAAAQKSGRKYSAVRCGNVLGSRGSVLPTFQRQIAAGGPVTVTHPDMYRYFMTIPEAVQLVLHTSTMSQGGEIFLLDMGNPVRILDMANDLIRLSGLQPGRDIKIVFSGIREGEKLREELFSPGEAFHRSEYDRILISSPQFIPDLQAFEEAVNQLIEKAPYLQPKALIRMMQKIVPEYHPAARGAAYPAGEAAITSEAGAARAPAAAWEKDRQSPLLPLSGDVRIAVNPKTGLDSIESE